MALLPADLQVEKMLDRPGHARRTVLHPGVIEWCVQNSAFKELTAGVIRAAHAGSSAAQPALVAVLYSRSSRRGRNPRFGLPNRPQCEAGAIPTTAAEGSLTFLIIERTGTPPVDNKRQHGGH